jgi:hypothetical protein
VAGAGEHHPGGRAADDARRGRDRAQRVDRVREQRGQGADQVAGGVGGVRCGVGVQGQQPQVPAVRGEQADRQDLSEPGRPQVLHPGAQLRGRHRHITQAHRRVAPVQAEQFDLRDTCRAGEVCA